MKFNRIDSSAKNVERLMFSIIRKCVVNQRLRTAVRFATILVSIVAWFTISNHCALGALASPKSTPVHAACHEDSPAPTKSPTKGESVPCCKMLRATLPVGNGVPAYNSLAFALQPTFAGLVEFAKQFRAVEWFELGTGPPFACSFAESVLQRSILAHAPPFSLS